MLGFILNLCYYNGMTKLEKKLTAEVESLKERIRLLEKLIFAPKSEKFKPFEDDSPQLKFCFDSAPKLETPAKLTPEALAEHASRDKKAEINKRKKKGKGKLPDNLPVFENIYDISEDEKICACGCPKTRIGLETSQQLQHVPAKFIVVKNIRFKYACKNCEGSESEKGAVSIAPVPQQIIPKSFATASLLAYIIISKFADAIPFYRLSKIFSRNGVELNRSTMCNWTIRISSLLAPMMELLKEILLLGPIINADETRFQVLNEKNRCPQAKSQMWSFRGGGDKPTIYFKYDESRAGRVADKFLNGFKGYIQTDGYSGYGFIKKNQEQVRVGCWAHARRKFFDSVKAAGENAKPGLAHEAVAIIKSLYKIEKDAREKCLKEDEILALRREKAEPILKYFKQKLDEWETLVPKRSLTGKAITYAKNQWKTLIEYTEDGRLQIDNNSVENAIRPIALGRKNWMFADSVAGAEAAANLFSLIETAKANDLDPYWYLMFLFNNLPKLKEKEDFRPFMPQFIDKSLIKSLMVETLDFAKEI